MKWEVLEIFQPDAAQGCPLEFCLASQRVIRQSKKGAYIRHPLSKRRLYLASMNPPTVVYSPDRWRA